MFGFSLQKILLLIAIISAVWYAFKYVGRLQKERGRKNRPAKRKTSSPASSDMIQCPKCDVYVTAEGAKPCGRKECPY
jgi:uncharacterized protein